MNYPTIVSSQLGHVINSGWSLLDECLHVTMISKLILNTTSSAPRDSFNKAYLIAE